jgi:hypothetical protein
MRMKTTDVTQAADGYEERTFECKKCNHAETRMLVVDPVKTHIADGWLKGELGQSTDE